MLETVVTSVHVNDYMVSDRAGIIENRHSVHAAVVDGNGRLLYAVGNPFRMTLARSTAKPAQALAILETGCFEQFGFNDSDLALVCASHSSEDRHIARAQAMLAKIGAEESDLACGGHPSLSVAVNRTWIKNDFSPGGLCNNCSGKHAGMLAGAKTTGAGFADYQSPVHPMQLRVKRVFEELCGSDAKKLKWGVDGCNLPAPALPLSVLARIYASFAAASDTVQRLVEVTTRTQYSAQIFRAMVTFPDLVGGEGRFCTEFMRAFKGSLMGKIGADGTYCIGVRASKQTRKLGAVGTMGIAVKIEDGNANILYAAVLEIVEQLGLGTPEMRFILTPFRCKDILNTAGVVTGHVTPKLKVRPMNG
jgi:L-asparaginase II